MNRPWGWVALAAIALSGCATTEQHLGLQREIVTLSQRVADLEKTLGSQRQGQQSSEQQLREQFTALAKRQAEQLAEVEAARVDLQSLRGQLDDAAARRREVQDNLTLLQDEVTLKLGSFDERLAKGEGTTTELKTTNEELKKALSELRRTDEEQHKALETLAARLAALPPPAGAPPGVPAAPAAPADAAPATLYERGRDLIQNKGDLTQARALLEEFLQRQPTSDLAANAVYWIGEAWYGEKKYENAILQFQDVLDKYPQHPKASAALFKQALAFFAMGDQKNGRLLLQRVVESYPRSEEAQKARERLDEPVKTGGETPQRQKGR